MKMTKRSTAIGAFLVGMMILITSAFADVMIESGYYSLKNSVKATMKKLSEEVDNFSVNVAATFKIDDKIYAEAEEVCKFDMVNQAKETIGTNMEKGEITESYYYADTKQNISKDSKTGKYYVWNKKKNKGMNNEDKIFENPFEDERVMDAEKIADAFVGNLQDVIEVEEIDNKKVYIGNLSDAQVPSLINAISSFIFKHSIFDEYTTKRMGVPYPKSNVYVTSISGKAIENSDGILESIIGSASISADDKNGITHTYTVEFSFDIKDINNTTVTPPDLEGQEVEYNEDSEYVFDEKYVGKYKNDIVKLEHNSFVKVGERYLEITSVVDGKVYGRYYEVYNEAYEESPVDFEFIAEAGESSYYSAFKYNDKNGEEKTGLIQKRQGKQNIYLLFDVEISEDGYGYSYLSYNEDFDNNFVRIFE
ncbi:MAG: hypothetical protein GX066_06205 [Clostridiaceae bacterium]|nr:hypothetical protein [Clostridiaceae bacterium]